MARAVYRWLLRDYRRAGGQYPAPAAGGKDTKMPDYLILITTLGGMEIYGINGFVIGPTVAALFITCWNLFSGRDHEGNVEGIDEAFMEEAKNPPDF